MKILFQEICKRKVDGDEELPDNLKAKWSTLLNNLKNTSVVEFPRRYVITTIEDPVVEYTLHGFSNASDKAYGANV